MTPTEQFLLNNAFGIAAAVVIGVIAYVKMNRVDAVEKKLSDHEKSLAPHADCPVHTTGLARIEKDVAEIKQTLANLDDRIYQLVSRMTERQ